ncbi:tripartite tricarboxylate transporter substrate binding protein [Bradyrhizobium sp. LHD-71]|uniref:Bug family tripartite tricarboxylate transporter substrate binding protein n=1 Tax=Bradyrhizobium sp. LHD-71 TaxID=3072141 RepID=UPI00280FA838|nr:tripartite tricarboxylate transporter substrate binding protein [Bradyrhizobium sp. LHD-71]MDQ8729342.1 tripartite tricarboxylate transporter substrate binding protein [Bradyrhizobium sp. LHD-71]
METTAKPSTKKPSTKTWVSWRQLSMLHLASAIPDLPEPVGQLSIFWFLISFNQTRERVVNAGHRQAFRDVRASKPIAMAPAPSSSPGSHFRREQRLIDRDKSGRRIKTTVLIIRFRRQSMAPYVSMIVLCLSLLCLPAHAQPASWPSRPIKLVLSGAPGTPPDLIGRMFASALSTSLSVPVVVENKTGVGSIIAMTAVVQAPADGYTLFYAVNNVFTVNPLIYGKEEASPSFVRKPLDAFEPVGTTIEQGLVVVANNAFPATNMSELIAQVRSRPGAISYGSYGAGSLPHLAIEQIAQGHGLDLIHVPYRTGVLQDLIGGQIAMLAEPVGTALPLIQSKHIKAIAYTGSKRHRSLPDVPTLPEITGGTAIFGWHSIWARAGTPAPVLRRLQAEMQKAAERPEVREKLQDMGYDPLIIAPDAIIKRLKDEAEMWATLVRVKNLNLGN